MGEPDDDQRAELWTELFATAPVAIQVYHLDDLDDAGSLRLVESTTGAADVAGVPRERMQSHVGKTMREFIPRFVTTGYPARYREVILSGRPVTVEVAYHGDDLDAVFHVHAWRLRGRYLGVQFENITERLRMERQLDAKMRELERSNAELDRFASVVSHDLHEPLRAIASFADLLARDYAERLDDEGNRRLDYVRTAAARLQIVLDGLLTYARLTRHERVFAPTDLAEVIADARERLVQSFDDSLAELHVGAMPTIEADGNLLSLLFQNLLSNAIRFAGETAPKIWITAELDGEQWRFAVRDRGIGFAPEHAEIIFGMFRRLAPDDRRGSGIGLASCKKIVEYHGGRIWAESEPGCGATFWFTLPERQIVP
jgi:signal transduction histidine kinase